MTYELAKKLKDAGFKQTAGFHLGKDMNAMCSPEDEIAINRASVPTLSELIEACGDKFAGIFKVKLLKGDSPTRQIWVAYDFKNIPSINEDFWKYPKYDTPEEAIANLWLKLNH